MNRVSIKPKFNNLVEQRLLSFMLGVGDPKHEQIMQIFSKIDEECFHARLNHDLFVMIKAIYDQGELFDVYSVLHQVPDELFALFTDLTSEKYHSINCVKYDVDTLLKLKYERQKTKIYEATLNEYAQSYLNSNCDDILNEGMKRLAEVGGAARLPTRPWACLSPTEFERHLFWQLAASHVSRTPEASVPYGASYCLINASNCDSVKT